MKCISAFAMAAMAAIAAARSPVPPAKFNLPMAANNTPLGVAFLQTNGGQPVEVQPGALFGKGVTMMQPIIALPLQNSSSLSREVDGGSKMIVVMIDPDAPSPNAPTSSQILHWFSTSLSAKIAPRKSGPLQGQAVLSDCGSSNLVPFLPPGPPATSSAHRYLLFLFAQPGNFTVPPQFSKFSAQSRAGFDLNAFVSAAQLQPPLAVNFMYVSGQEVVPADFQGAPFSMYPGGNGNAISLPGATADVASNGTASIMAVPPAATGTAGVLITGSMGQTVTGLGTIGTDGNCFCNVACPAGPLH